MASTGKRSPRLPRGLNVVLAVLCITETVSWGILYYGFPVLNPAISADTGWTQMSLTGAFSMALVVSAATGVWVGRIIDRHGPRHVMTLGSALGAVALVIVALAPTLPVFVAGWLLGGVAMAATLYPPAFAALTHWFGERRLLALAILTFAGGLASTIFAPITAALEESLGWRETYLWGAVALAVLTIPLHWFLLRRPWRTGEDEDDEDGGDGGGSLERSVSDRTYASGILRTVRFRMLVAGQTVVALATLATLFALVPLMLERGMSTQAAAWVLGLGGLGQVAGRLFYTAVADRYSLMSRTAVVYPLGAVSLLALAVVPGPLAVLVALSVLAGVGRGIATLLQATAVTDRWGPRAYGRLSGVMGLPVLLASAAAPFTSAVLAEVSGSYAAAFGVLGATSALGAGLMIVSARRL